MQKQIYYLIVRSACFSLARRLYALSILAFDSKGTLSALTYLPVLVISHDFPEFLYTGYRCVVIAQLIPSWHDKSQFDMIFRNADS